MPGLSPSSSAFVAAALPGVSRTFALGISLLRQPLRDQVGVAYLVCRVLDTLEDGSEMALRSRQLLLRMAADAFARDVFVLKEANSAVTGIPPMKGAGRFIMLGSAVENLAATSPVARPDRELCRAATSVFDAYLDLPPVARLALAPPVIEMATGMAAAISVDHAPVESTDDLDAYCYTVAGTVGKLLTGLFAADRSSVRAPETLAALNRDAVAFGLGLQMTNVIKDVTDDYARGVVYVPAAWLRSAGASMEELLRDPSGAGARSVVAAFVRRTLSHLDAALRYTLAVPASERDVRLFCALPMLLALRTLSAAARDAASFEPGRAVKITRPEVSDLHAEAEAAAGDDRALAALHARERAAVEAGLRG